MFLHAFFLLKLASLEVLWRPRRVFWVKCWCTKEVIMPISIRYLVSYFILKLKFSPVWPKIADTSFLLPWVLRTLKKASNTVEVKINSRYQGIWQILKIFLEIGIDRYLYCICLITNKQQIANCVIWLFYPNIKLEKIRRLATRKNLKEMFFLGGSNQFTLTLFHLSFRQATSLFSTTGSFTKQDTASLWLFCNSL